MISLIDYVLESNSDTNFNTKMTSEEAIASMSLEPLQQLLGDFFEYMGNQNLDFHDKPFSANGSGTKFKLKRDYQPYLQDFIKDHEGLYKGFEIDDSKTNPPLLFNNKRTGIIFGDGSSEKKVPTSVSENWVVNAFNNRDFDYETEIGDKVWRNSIIIVTKELRNYVKGEGDNWIATRIDNTNEIGDLYEKVLVHIGKKLGFNNRNPYNPSDILLYKPSKESDILKILNNILSMNEVNEAKHTFVDMLLNKEGEICIGISLKKVLKNPHVYKKNYPGVIQTLKIQRCKLKNTTDNQLLVDIAFMKDGEFYEGILQLRNFGSGKPQIAMDMSIKSKGAITGKIAINKVKEVIDLKEVGYYEDLFKQQYPNKKFTNKETWFIIDELKKNKQNLKNLEDKSKVEILVRAGLREGDIYLPFIEIS